MIDLHFGIMFSVGDNQKRKHQVHEKKNVAIMKPLLTVQVMFKSVILTFLTVIQVQK